MRPLRLASRSPRRRDMLEAAGIPHVVEPAGIDDGTLVPGRGIDPAAWVAALAHLKARWVRDHGSGGSGGSGESGESGGAGGSAEPDGREPDPHELVLGADTVCVGPDGRILGQPADADEAAAMLRSFRGGTHPVASGVALVRRGDGARRLLVDVAQVTWGDVPDAAIDDYLATDAWRGKAGGYNLADRIEAGWPIACTGDPDTVMGLPMRRLAAWLERAFAADAAGRGG